MSEKVENSTDTKSDEIAMESTVETSTETKTIDDVDNGSENKQQIQNKEQECTNLEPNKIQSVQIESLKAIEMESFSGATKPETEQNEMIEEKPVESIPSNHPKDVETLQENEGTMETQDDNTVPPLANKSKQDTATIGSLGLLNQYASSSDEDEDSSGSDDDSESEDNEDTDSSSNSQVIETPAAEEKELNTIVNSILNNVMSRENYREADTDTSESDLDDSDVECIGSVATQTIDITNDEDIQEFLDACEANTSGPVKTKGELGMDDLPPIAELTITVPESDCVELGSISGIVDTLVLVESLAGFAAVDIDTVLFLDKGNRTLGQVFDVMGNVASPIYCVRFNTTQDIQAKNITAGLKVYVAPQTEYTNFIVLSNLMKEKGCDASWEYDNEAPDGCNEFSDDEEERLNRRQQNQRQRNKNRTSESNEHPPMKVTVKTEPNSNYKGRRPKYNHRQPQNGGDQQQPTRFYKDNRGYAITNTDSSNFYHQRMPPSMQHQNYSWHTAQMHQMHPSMASTSNPSMMQFPPPYTPQHGSANVYPNPFAMQANPMNYVSPFNLSAFPPLPPINTIPPHHQPPQLNSPYNRKKSSSASFQHHQQ
ncbi:H/ACA ribonucleoprotein complex non-core subunit NAF1 [Contarinia nasturtii]|uniref:H/ACA ribonucleoprotein complex non-core subunit NAF1 n=1 Tax=Contarinia nasturtii TaxID=265458 RepID=UPI0012D46162|nr:H/ACA ribonucleoprotein complex non-core subunit NAF1 [Contarinia nasturtii]